jgi:hypothetical protein
MRRREVNAPRPAWGRIPTTSVAVPEGESMHRALLPLTILLAASAIPARADETLACKTNTKLGGKASKGAELTLVLDGTGQIKDLQYSGYFASGKEGGAGFCDIQREEDDTWTWTRKGPLTILTIDSDVLGESLKLEIESRNDAYEIRFSDSKLYQLCGAAASFPTSVTLRRGQPTCKVVESQ